MLKSCMDDDEVIVFTQSWIVIPLKSCIKFACFTSIAGIFLNALTTIVHIHLTSDNFSFLGCLFECMAV